jgi:hypothetical protein
MFEYSQLLDAALLATNPEDQMALVAAFSIGPSAPHSHSLLSGGFFINVFPNPDPGSSFLTSIYILKKNNNLDQTPYLRYFQSFLKDLQTSDDAFSPPEGYSKHESFL